MTNAHAIGRRGRVLKRAHQRAQRRFHAMFEAHVWSDPQARATILYLQAERLVDAIMFPEQHATPVAVVVESLGHWRNGWQPFIANEDDKLAEYWNRGA